jgi:hypothetical protein
MIRTRRVFLDFPLVIDIPHASAVWCFPPVIPSERSAFLRDEGSLFGFAPLQPTTCRLKRRDGEHYGNRARILRTCLCVNRGAFGPAVSTGHPVAGSLMIRTRRVFLFFDLIVEIPHSSKVLSLPTAETHFLAVALKPD